MYAAYPPVAAQAAVWKYFFNKTSRSKQVCGFLTTRPFPFEIARAFPHACIYMYAKRIETVDLAHEKERRTRGSFRLKYIIFHIFFSL